MGAVAGAAAAAMIRAARASGVIVKIQPSDFAALAAHAAKSGDPLVVAASGGFFNKYFDYLMSYKGLAFYTRSPDPVPLPPQVELVSATKIWIPGN